MDQKQLGKIKIHKKHLKDKIRNLKDAYKTLPTYSPYFEDFDEVLGTHVVINTPFAQEGTTDDRCNFFKIFLMNKENSRVRK